MKIGARLSCLAISDIRAMTRACDQVSGINLGQGVCDLPTPPKVAEGAISAIQKNLAIYAPPSGLPSLRKGVADKIQRDYGISYDPDTEIVIANGATGAFAATILALFEPGDEIILFEPYYGYHLNTVIAMGLTPVLVPLSPPTWDVDQGVLAALEKAIGPKTRGLVLCTPSNPCGKVFSSAELDCVAALCEKHDLTVVTDEIYEHIVFDKVPHVQMATRGQMRARTVTIAGFSKTFAITGWRIGYLAAPPAAAQVITVAHDLLYVCPPTPLQHAAVAGLSMDRSYFTELAQTYQQKRDILCSALADAGLTPYVPAGAYYVLSDIRKLGFATSKEAAMALLSRCGIASVPGTSFYRDPVGQTLTRFCFAKENEVLIEAARRLRAL